MVDPGDFKLLTQRRQVFCKQMKHVNDENFFVFRTLFVNTLLIH